MREESTVKGALAVKPQNVTKYKNFDGSGSSSKSTNAKGNWKKSYPPCQHYGKKGHPPFRRWKRLDAKFSECNQMGREAIIYKSKNQPHAEVARSIDQEEEKEYLFAATCFSSIESSQN